MKLLHPSKRKETWQYLNYAEVPRLCSQIKSCESGFPEHNFLPEATARPSSHSLSAAFPSTDWRLRVRNLHRSCHSCRHIAEHISGKWKDKMTCCFMESLLPCARWGHVFDVLIFSVSSFIARETYSWKHCHKSLHRRWGARADVMLSWMFSVTQTTGGKLVSGQRI